MAHKQLSNSFLGSQIDVIMKESRRKNIITVERIDGKGAGCRATPALQRWLSIRMPFKQVFLDFKVAPYSFFDRARADFENFAMARAFKLHIKVARGITQ